jgi:hypothetical protein
VLVKHSASNSYGTEPRNGTTGEPGRPFSCAFLGFQFAIVFAQGFEQLPRQLLHFVSLLATTIATVLLITPAPYHRIHEAGGY